MTTSADRGGDGGDDNVSIRVEEEDGDEDDEDGLIIEVEDINFKSGCSRRLLKNRRIDFLHV